MWFKKKKKKMEDNSKEKVTLLLLIYASSSTTDMKGSVPVCFCLSVSKINLESLDREVTENNRLSTFGVNLIQPDGCYS